MNEAIDTIRTDQVIDTICGANSSPKLREQVEKLLQRYDTDKLQITPENLELIIREAERIFEGYCEQNGYTFFAVTEIQPKQVSNPSKFYYSIYGQAIEPEERATVPLHVNLKIKEEQVIEIVGKGVRENQHI